MRSSDPRIETMMEPMHPTRLEKKANIKGESALQRLMGWIFQPPAVPRQDDHEK